MWQSVKYKAIMQAAKSIWFEVRPEIAYYLKTDRIAERPASSSIISRLFTYCGEYYGMEFRIWTHEPTEAEREGVRWWNEPIGRKWLHKEQEGNRREQSRTETKN